MYAIWARILGKYNNRDKVFNFNFLTIKKKLCFKLCIDDNDNNGIECKPFGLCIFFSMLSHVGDHSLSSAFTTKDK